MKKKNTFIRVLALSLCAIVLCLSLASCTSGDKIKTGAADAWEKVKDGAEDIYNSVTDKSTGDIELNPISNMHIQLTSNVIPSGNGDASYKTTLTASDFANCTVATNGAGANYVTYKQYVGSITAVTGAEQADYWTATAGDKPIVAVDGNFSYVCVVLPSAYTDAATWAAAANDFSVTVTPVMAKELTATVLPDEATNKAVTWSVSVETNPDGDEIDPADYLRILTYEGLWQNKITVLALCPFPDYEFKITCTTVVGGYTADCLVKFNGEPSSLSFYTDNADGSQNNISDQIDLLAGQTYNIKFSLGNVFNLIGSEYGTYEIVSVEYHGVMKNCIKVGSSNVYSADKTISNANGAITVDGEAIDGDSEQYQWYSMQNFLVASIINGQLVLDLVNAPDGYVYGTYYDKNHGVTETYYIKVVEPFVFTLEVKETVSGVHNKISFTIDPVATTVSLSVPNLVF